MTCCSPADFAPHPEADPDCATCNGDGYQDSRDLFTPEQCLWAPCSCVGTRAIAPAVTVTADVDGWLPRDLASSRAPARYYGDALDPAAVWAIVLHNLATGRQGTGPHYFADPPDGRKVSAHLVCHWDGTATQCVPLTRRAYHAGAANGWSLGVEMDAPRGEPWPEVLLARVERLVEALRARFPRVVELRSHRSLSPLTRRDPESWNWQRWEGSGLTLVP